MKLFTVGANSPKQILVKPEDYSTGNMRGDNL
jgi:hypothetical protein